MRRPDGDTAPLRVLQVAARYLPDLGGIETHLDEVATRLARSPDFSITVLATDRGGRLPRYERRAGFDVRRVRARPEHRDYHLAPGIYPWVRRGPWDLVHVQGIHTPVPVLAMLAARRAGLPYVVTFHTGGHSLGHRHALRSAQWRALGPLLRRADALIGVSRFEADLFVRLAGVDPERVSVISNGGALPLGAGDAPVIPGRIVSSGRLERYKGHHRVIEALPHVRAVVPDATLDILGSGPFEPRLRELVATLGLQDAVRIRQVPPRDRRAMASALAGAAVVAAFSDYEAHPVAVMEALTLGRPVVGYDVAGMADLVADGLVTGLTSGSPPQVAAAALVQRMRGGGRAILDLPTWDTCAAAVADVYRLVASR